ncbi:hypothetical protein [Clostridium cadaveris]|uniref:hypothetical protein n=1 Tax=Clostridium cadaveris TaxID=1529 RepID=UPI000C078DEA|nr:hypothetical protein [Clostridium cadaveris]
MKKIFSKIIAGVIIVGMVLVVGKAYTSPTMNIKNKDMEWNIIYKGLKDSRDFTIDDEDNTFIAFRNKIQMIDSLGQSRIIYENKDLDIYDIEYFKGNIYISTDNRILSLNIKSGDIKEILKDIPNKGDYKKISLIASGNKLYASIGAATNSGVVGEDNDWIKDDPYFHDTTPIDIVVRGKNFNNGNTGAYSSYNTKVKEDDVIKASMPANASLISYDFSTEKWNLYCYGVRNIDSMDYNSNGEIYGTVGGIEPRGVRGIEGDSDYIYEFKSGKWYGWPDYSGGDPIISPRFISSTNEAMEYIIKKHPTKNPEVPYYQHSSLTALGTMAVDRNGILGEKDSIYFYDRQDKVIYTLEKKGTAKEKIKLSNGDINALKFTEESLRVLDGETGVLYDITKAKSSIINPMNNSTLYGSIIIIVSMIVAFAWKIRRRR